MVLSILRGVFLLLVAAVVTLYLNTEFQEGLGYGFAQMSALIIGAIALAAGVVAVDAYTHHKKLSAVSGIFLGLVAGLLAAYALSFVVDLVGIYAAPEELRQREAFLDLLRGVKVVIGLVTCYVGISLVIQTKDDFRFVIPYVEFAKQVRGFRPVLLDTSVIVDGRILDIIETRTLQGILIVPKFVLDELQLIADSPDRLKRARGRRGLDMLQKLQGNPFIEISIEEHEAEGANVDQKLISLADVMRARVMTNDYNLNKIATLRGVEVINLNDLAKALRPVVLPGEHMTVKVVKPGESAGQGVGYLDDGTMVVIENARDAIGQDVDLTVTSTLQTSAGRMIFGKVGHSDGSTMTHAVYPTQDPPHTDDPNPPSANLASPTARPRTRPSNTPGNPRTPRRSN